MHCQSHALRISLSGLRETFKQQASFKHLIYSLTLWLWSLKQSSSNFVWLLVKIVETYSVSSDKDKALSKGSYIQIMSKGSLENVLHVWQHIFQAKSEK